MHKQGVGGFPYFVGIESLSEIATRKDRVCVLNILGSESSRVTPTSHEFSGGNVVFGTGPGKAGMVLDTGLGPIPVFDTIKDGLEAGHEFNTGVVYLPPAGVRDGVLELVRFNPELEKVIIITEKVSVKDSRTIRAVCQLNGVDLFGANCLGVADAWNKVRLGGALGGSNPEESLVKGSIAIYSNSGNFTTTVAVYLLSQGWGTTTSISSGKDIYIHYSPREFMFALDNDQRSKAAVVYVEPGGYYEYGLKFKKPVIACVVGRWKARITRACGHAGSLAGSGDDALAKQRWFMDYFGVRGIFTPDNPVFSEKGALVTNIAHIPEALTAVMAANNTEPDFESRGDLKLKCWFANNQGIKLPPPLDLPVVEAIPPYNRQIASFARQVGARYTRQSLKDASGASVMDPKTQVTSLHSISVIDASGHSLEENLVLSLIKDYPHEKGRKLANIVLNACVNMPGQQITAASDASRSNDNYPNAVLSAAVSILGRKAAEGALRATKVLLDLFQHDLAEDPYGNFDYQAQLETALEGSAREVLLSESGDERAAAVMKAVADSNSGSIFTSFLYSLAEKTGLDIPFDSLLAAAWTTIGWSALKRKRISKLTIQLLPWYSLIFSAFIGCSVGSEKHAEDSFCGVKTDELISDWSFTETAFVTLRGRRPTAEELFEFTVMLGLIISNGPGTISAQGAKGAVSADGPLQPDKVQINKGFVGFLSHTGRAHGGNGFDAIEFLLERFENQDPGNPGGVSHGLDLRKMARAFSREYLEYKVREKAVGNMEYRKIPCVNHPVFKGKAVNIDPREDYVRHLFKEKNIHNVFLDFYHELVEALFENGVSDNVYCVNIDAVIAVILLKMFWEPLRSGRLSEKDIENAAFTSFLYGRMVGSAAEIDDHLNRGLNMDTRTPADQCLFIG